MTGIMHAQIVAPLRSSSKHFQTQQLHPSQPASRALDWRQTLPHPSPASASYHGLVDLTPSRIFTELKTCS